MFKNGYKSSRVLKLTLKKQHLSSLGSHAQLKKLEPYLPVMIFGNSMHSAVVVKNLGVRFDANFSFVDHIRNICKTCFIQMHDLRWVRQYLTDKAAKSKFGFYVLFNSQDHIGTGPQNCHLWNSNQQK